MNEGTIFLNQGLLWPTILGGLLLWALFIWKEWPERNSVPGRIKVLVSLLGLLALALLVLKPTLPRPASGKGILLTEGHRPQDLDSLKSRYRGIPVESYRPGEALDRLEEIDSIFILGRGPQPYDGWQFEDRSISFLGADPPSGPVKLTHPGTLYLGEELLLGVKYLQPKAGHWVLLKDSGGNSLDSVAMVEEPEQHFRLGTTPKSTGLYEYSLEERDPQGKLVLREPIPVEIGQRHPLDILMLNRFPTFEGKYLKNFLAQRGHSLLVRSQMSRDKYRFEYLNRPAAPIRGLDREQLEGFDLIVMDAGTYLGLGPSTKANVEHALKEHGTGLLVLPDSQLFNGTPGNFPLGFVRDPQTTIPLEDSPRDLEKYPFSFRQQFPMQPITMDGIPLASYTPMERGRIATTLIKDSYGLLLSGETELYSKLWTTVVEAAVGPRELGVQWQGITTLPRVDAPFEFQLRANDLNPQVMTAEGAQIPLLQDFHLPVLWRGTQYPKKVGWNRMEIQGDSLSTFNYFVFSEDQRKAVGQMELLRSNGNKYGKNFVEPENPRHGKRVPLSPYWFFVPFLLCMGWLWLQPKLRA